MRANLQHLIERRKDEARNCTTLTLIPGHLRACRAKAAGATDTAFPIRRMSEQLRQAPELRRSVIATSKSTMPAPTFKLPLRLEASAAVLYQDIDLLSITAHLHLHLLMSCFISLPLKSQEPRFLSSTSSSIATSFNSGSLRIFLPSFINRTK